MQIKKMKNSISRLVAVLLAIVICSLGVFSVDATERQTRTVRTCINYNDFLRIDENGNVYGYYAEYLEKLGDVNGWEYEYIEANWTEAMNMLQKGEIDFLFPTNYTEERDKIMDFTSMPIGYTASGLFALESSGYYYNDFAALNGARISYVKNSSNEYELIDFAKEHNFEYVSVYSDSNADTMQALRDGRADLGVFSAANEFPDGVIVSMTEAKPVYFSVKEGNSEMLSQLNNGMQELLNHNPDLVSDVLSKTLTGNNSSAIAMTKQEKKFVESGASVTIGFYEEIEPLAYVNSDGEYNGVYIELLTFISERSGLNILLYPISQSDNWEELVKNGTIDFFVGSADAIISSNDEYYSTNQLIEYANILITDNDCAFNTLEKPVIALTKGRTYTIDYLKNSLGKDIEVKFYRTGRECMLAVVKGEADASLINNLEFYYNSKNARLSSLIQWPQYRFPTGVCLVASNQVDDDMFSAVNKAVDMLDNEFAASVIDEYNSAPYVYHSFSDMLYSARITLAVVGVVLLVLSTLVLLTKISIRKQQAIKKEAHERERNQLQILAALSRNDAAIYYTDLDMDKCEILQFAEGSESKIPRSNTHSGALSEYIENFVMPQYKEILYPLCDPQEVIKRFKTGKDFSVRFEVMMDNEIGYYEMHFVDISAEDDEHKMVFGVRCVNNLVKEEQEQQKLLRDALDCANRANAAKSEFLSRMSHDIRTPMNAIIGMTSIAEAHIDEPERVSDSLAKISNASHHLLDLINDVLDMSKIESGKFSLNEKSFNLNELIDNMLSMMQPQIKEHNHSLETDVKNIRHNQVIGDSLRIQQAFINIMGNAVKYTPNGGRISLTVREIPVKAVGVGCYEFVFSDNGIGMTKKIQENIFDMFTRADDSQTSKIQGTGLGLSITRNIAQMMNGSIHVDSELGKGSTFTMTIFLKLQDNDVNNNKIMPDDNKVNQNSRNDLTGHRVLLVEDNELNREIAREFLEMRNLDIEEAHNGLEAVEKFSLSEKGYYDIILMDIQMPLMNGYDATAKIRGLDHPDAKSIPIIAMTANAFVEDIQNAKNAGMNEHLSKPIDFDKFSNVLNEYLH